MTKTKLYTLRGVYGSLGVMYVVILILALMTFSTLISDFGTQLLEVVHPLLALVVVILWTMIGAVGVIIAVTLPLNWILDRLPELPNRPKGRNDATVTIEEIEEELNPFSVIDNATLKEREKGNRTTIEEISGLLKSTKDYAIDKAIREGTLPSPQSKNLVADRSYDDLTLWGIRYTWEGLTVIVDEASQTLEYNYATGDKEAKQLKRKIQRITRWRA